MSKHIVFLLIGLMCSFHASGQKVSYEQIKGDTYRWNFVAGWELCTGEQISKKPMRRNIAGYETTCTTRICPDKSLGISVSVLEFKECKDYKVIQKRDSLLFTDKAFYRSACWRKPANAKVNRTVELECAPVKHQETGKDIYMKMKKWYVQGKKNVYVIDFVSSSTLGWEKWLPEMEKAVQSLEETGDVQRTF